MTSAAEPSTSSETHVPAPEPIPPGGGASPVRLALAWGVHLFTACGAICGAAALLQIAWGDLAQAALWILVAFFIDSVDGGLARAVGVSRALPSFDGRRLDDMVDYLNYVVVSVVFMVAAGSLSHWAWAAVPILASAYGFSQADAKTDDGFFVGFPSYWNVIALYLWLLDISPAVGTAIVAVFSVLVFVPFRYVYPSGLRRFRGTTAALALAAWTLVIVAILDPERGRALHLVEISLVLPAWYLGLSAHLGGIQRRSP